MGKHIKTYQSATGNNPFRKWFRKLDKSIKEKIIQRIDKLKETGHYGDQRYLENGISELKFKTGHRIYFSELDNKILILLLYGGNKDSQQKDISKAIKYLQNYLN